MSRLQTLAAEYATSFLERTWSDSRLQVVADAREAISSDADQAWAFVREVFRHVTLPTAQYVGADLLEDFLVLHASTHITDVFAQADVDDVFFAALRCVSIPEAGEEIWRRLNQYLRVRGVPEEELPDWSGYRAADPES